MKAHHLIASIAAVLITAATLTAVNYNVASQPAATISAGITVTDLAPVEVRPSASDLRDAALSEAPGAGLAAVPADAFQGGSGAQLSLIGSQLAMPYYSFGNKFGRITKE